MGSVFDLLDREWVRLRDDKAVARRLPEACKAAGGAKSLAGVERFVRTASPPDADRVLATLVAGAIRDDRLASRVLLQLLLPGVRRLARTWWALGDADERAAAAIAAVYGRICRYPLQRRPQRVAANILWDAASDLRRTVRRAALAHTDVPLVHDAPTAEAPHPALELADELRAAVADGRLSADDANLIAATRIAGTPMREMAHRRGAKLRTLQWRRQRAEAALAGTDTAA